MLDDLYVEFKEQMEGALKAFDRELTKLRTGRAHASMLDGIKVDYYGTPTALSPTPTTRSSAAVTTTASGRGRPTKSSGT